ncbi:MAG TPA: cytochrome c3 family protein [Dehalococcoidia bacterium]|nr:cytochrome c3 family protein [Dehalococcoidia bacterium]
MPQLFPRASNAIARAGILGAAGLAGLLVALWADVVWSPIDDGISEASPQPVFFSHRVHAELVEIDCRYCHTSVDVSSFVRLPSTETCLQCHPKILADSSLIEPGRESFRTGQPLRWHRVSDLPDHVYFDHSIHVRKRVGCTTCHGQIDELPLPT